MRHQDLGNLFTCIAVCEFLCLVLHFMIVVQNMEFWFFLTICITVPFPKRKTPFTKEKLPGRNWNQYVSHKIYMQILKNVHVNRACFYRGFQKVTWHVTHLILFQLSILCSTRTYRFRLCLTDQFFRHKGFIFQA